MQAVLLGLVVVTGLAGVACSVLVYHVVRRPYWHAAYGGFKFAGTAVVLGLATALAASGVASMSHDPDMPGGPASSWPLTAVAMCLIAATCAKLWIEARLARWFCQVGTGCLAEDEHASSRSSPAAGRIAASLRGRGRRRPAGGGRRGIGHGDSRCSGGRRGPCSGRVDRRGDGRAVPFLHRGRTAEDAGRLMP